ncbi:fimbria/pilus periplasmic chaperone [Vibrio nomapromontoriensis]|uniref:fimbria/pilus periplasmic chaperone n=1 Tax=Vibrio nomapromontoriensis TaxID=2910246 RepID=UPI003D101F32
MNSNKILLLMALLMCWSVTASAAFVLNTTRVVVSEKDKYVSFEVSNQGTEEYGGQVWIENPVIPGSDGAFVAIPAFFRVGPGEKQIVRIVNASRGLDGSKEHLYWLNVQEIPPKPKNKNVIQLAVRSKIKLFYRPLNLRDGRKDVESEIFIGNTNAGYILRNDSPYFLSIVAIKDPDGNKIQLSNNVANMLATFRPFEEVIIGNSIPKNANTLTVFSMNDYGGVSKYDIEIKR